MQNKGNEDRKQEPEMIWDLENTGAAADAEEPDGGVDVSKQCYEEACAIVKLMEEKKNRVRTLNGIRGLKERKCNRLISEAKELEQGSPALEQHNVNIEKYRAEVSAILEELCQLRDEIDVHKKKIIDLNDERKMHLRRETGRR